MKLMSPKRLESLITNAIFIRVNDIEEIFLISRLFCLDNRMFSIFLHNLPLEGQIKFHYSVFLVGVVATRFSQNLLSRHKLKSLFTLQRAFTQIFYDKFMKVVKY